jgi:hypothetical protein
MSKKHQKKKKREANSMENTAVADAPVEMMETVPKSLTPEQSEELVLFPETHNTKVKLLDVDVELRPLPIGISKKISKQMEPISNQFAKMGANQEENPDLDMNTIESLMDCIMLLAGFYKLPSSISKERLEEEALTEDLIDLLKAQLVLNKENNFLLQNLRGVLRIVELAAEMQNRPTSVNPSSTPPIATDGESASRTSSETTPTGS